jgi:hypothetical protein
MNSLVSISRLFTERAQALMEGAPTPGGQPGPERAAMLSSRKTRFQWSKQDRGSDVPLFRSMAQHWHPTVRTHGADVDDAKPPPARVEPVSGNESATWTPWQWAD